MTPIRWREGAREKGVHPVEPSDRPARGLFGSHEVLDPEARDAPSTEPAPAVKWVQPPPEAAPPSLGVGLVLEQLGQRQAEAGEDVAAIQLLVSGQDSHLGW